VMAFLTESLIAWSRGLVMMARRVPGRSARPAGGEGGRLLAQGGGETGQSPGAACYAEPAFQPGHGGLADTGLLGELFWDRLCWMRRWRSRWPSTTIVHR
jgi:hypothetical protein